MSDTPIEEQPPEASASGKNTLCVGCIGTDQSLHYAACLNRINTLETDYANAPSAWKGRGSCETAIVHGECVAYKMRAQEKEAGKALFFVPRGVLTTLNATASKWLTAWNKLQAKRAELKDEPKSVRKAVEKDMFDAMGELGSFADAISGKGTSTFKTATVKPKPKTIPIVAASPSKPVGPLPVALPGETPVQFAMRMRKEAGNA